MYSSTIKTVAIHIGSGNLHNEGFPRVTAELRTKGDNLKVIGSLPPESNLVELYQRWRFFYQSLCDRQSLRSHIEEEDDSGLEIEEGGLTNISEKDFQDLCQSLETLTNDWLKSSEFLNIDRQLRRALNPEDEIRLIIETRDETLRGLPWYCWDFFKDYPQAEMILSSQEYQSPPNSQLRYSRGKVRILAILGSSEGIDFSSEIYLLENLQDAEIVFLNQPSRQELNNYLWDVVGWDILFFAGHSNTESESGRIYINENKTGNSLTIEQLREALKEAINNGLKIAIFNSCEGLGLANSLGKLYIPTVIVMREPVPNLVAQEFFKTFLNMFVRERLSLNLAVQKARRKLQGLENEFPGASWLPVICQNPAVELPTWQKLGGIVPCPYRGLSAFGEKDAEFFFGREEFTDNLVRQVKRKSLVAVVGASGSGKSSVVFAGMVPQLRQDTTQNWQIVFFRPGKNPFEALAIALISWQHPGEDKDNRLAELELETELKHNSANLSQILEQIVTKESHLCSLVVIVDQFEELYTLTPEVERQPFLDALLHACDWVPGLKLVITLRADFYGYALSCRPFSDALQDGALNNGSMTREELLNAIEKPAAKMQTRFEEGLINKLIDGVWGEPGRLPLLEFALTQLWSKIDNGLLTHKAYEEIGGVDLALANYAEQVFAGLSLVDRERSQKVFMQLVRLGEGTEATRRLATFDEVKSENWDLVIHLANERLLVTNYNKKNDTQTVEIIHEALIRNWRRLQKWMQVDGDFRRWQEQLRGAIYQWESNNHDEGGLLRGISLTIAEDWQQNRYDELNQREVSFINKSLKLRENEVKKNKQRQRNRILGLSAGLALAVGLAGVAWLQSRKANIREVQAIATSSDALFVSNNRLDALKEAIKAKRKIQNIPFVDINIKNQVKDVLEKSILQIFEYNRFQHKDDVVSIAYSADGKMIASGTIDGKILLWKDEEVKPKTINVSDNDKAIIKLQFNHKSGVLASASKGGLIEFRKSDGTRINLFKADSEDIDDAAFSPDGNLIAVAGKDKKIKLWKCNIQSWECKRELVSFQIPQEDITDVYSIVFSSESDLIASGYRDGTIRIWNKTGKLLEEINKPQQKKDNRDFSTAIWSLAFSPDDKYIASASEDRKVKIWNQNGTLFKELKDNGNNSHNEKVNRVVFSSDGKYIASASKDNTVKIWNLEGKLLKTFKGHTETVLAVAFHPKNNNMIASGSYDKTVRLWKTSFQVHNDTVKAISFSPNAQLIASASDDRTIKFCNKDGSKCNTLRGHKDWVNDIAFSSDGKVIVSGSDDGTVKLWNCDTQNPACDNKSFQTITLPAIKNNQNNYVNGIALSPNNQLIATTSRDNKVRIWQCNLKNWQCNIQKPLELNRHQKAVTDVAFSPDGNYIASASRDNNVIIWKRQGDDWKYLITLKRHTDEVNKVTFSPDGNYIASASRDKKIILWKRQENSWKSWKSLESHEDAVQDVAFNKNGKFIASASEDRKMKIWNSDGNLLDTIEAHEDKVFAVTFSSIDNTIASAGKDRKVVVWNLDTILDADKLTNLGCSWLEDYFKTTPDNDGLCSK